MEELKNVRIKIISGEGDDYPNGIRVINANTGKDIEDCFALRYEADVSNRPVLTLKIRNPIVEVTLKDDVEFIEQTVLNSEYKEYKIIEKEKE